MLTIARESPRQDAVIALLNQSDALMASLYPAESNHMLDLDSLCGPMVHFLVARHQGAIIGCGAFVAAGDGHAEIKRVFVDPQARGLGAGRALMLALEAAAARAGIRMLQLEMGIHQPEALNLYRGMGFVERGPFGAYQPDPLSLFMEKPLSR